MAPAPKFRPTVLLAGLLTLVANLVSAEHARSGRIDIYVVHKAFDLSDRAASAGARVSNCPWLGEGKENAGASAEVLLNPRGDWQKLWIEFVAQGDGEVDIDLQGEYYQKTAPDDIRLMWADNVIVEGEGAQIVNGSFEEADEDGMPVGWHFTSRFTPDRYSRDGSVAQFGDACVAPWYGSQARQAFAVKRGEKYRVTAWFRVFEVDPVQVALLERVQALAPHFDYYEQTLEIEFRDEASAKKAELRILPLYNGHEWAISSRWDDNNLADLKMRDVLEKHGYKGNFYLNGTERGFHGNPYGHDEKPGANVGAKLLPGGNAVGAHSWTHPMLTFCNRNRIFEEVMQNRIDWESSIDHPVNSYAFSFCNFRNGLEGDEVHIDIAEALFRAGFLHNANGRFTQGIDLDMPASWLLPADGLPIDQRFAQYLRDDGLKEKNPNISLDMHVWYRTPEAWAKFEEQLDKYGGNPEWWYCNQNEYGAYRWQYTNTSVETKREGRKLVATLKRPCLYDLNDAIPLTVDVLGVAAQDMTRVESGGAGIEVAEAQNGLRIHLSHDSAQRLPVKIGWGANPNNQPDSTNGPVDPEFPSLRGSLSHRSDALRLWLRNDGAQPLKRLRITYRLPLAWRDGAVRREVQFVSAGSEHRDTLLLKPERTEYKYRAGVGFYVAQLDFLLGAEAHRLYLTCRVPPPPRDPSYPHGGFLRMGPIPESEFSTEKALAAASKADGWSMGEATRGGFLGAEVIPTTCVWRHAGDAPMYYLLRSTVESEVEQEVSFLTDRGMTTGIVVNGEEADAARATLRKGANRLLLVHKADGTFRASNAGAFLRITSPGSKKRLTDVMYRAE